MHMLELNNEIAQKIAVFSAGPIFALAEVYEFDERLGDDRLTYRLELFQAVGMPTRFRCVIKTADPFLMKPSALLEVAPEEVTEEVIYIVASSHFVRNLRDYEAPDLAAARSAAFEELLRHLQR